MSIRPLDLADERVLAVAYDVESAANEHARPGWVGGGADARALGWRADDSWSNRLLGAWDGATLQGFAACMTSDDVPDTTWILVCVHPDHQGHGIGADLLQTAERACPRSTTRFVTNATRPRQEDLTALERRFLSPLGYRVATTETVVELDLAAAQLADVPMVEGYTVSSYVDGIPERFRQQVGQLKGLVDAEAPHGELGWEETAVSPKEYAGEIDLRTAQGRSSVESIAVDTHGNVVAWTCIVAPGIPGKAAWIEGTLVLKDHRGHGLGAGVKLASLHEARRLGGIDRVTTSSDDQNVRMRSINTALGFLPVEVEAIFQKVRTDDGSAP